MHVLTRCEFVDNDAREREKLAKVTDAERNFGVVKYKAGKEEDLL